MNIALRRYLRCASIKHKAFSSTAILEEIDIRMFNTALCSAKEGQYKGKVAISDI